MNGLPFILICCRGYNILMETRKPAPLFNPPLLNAAGTLGFAPDLHSGVPWERLGGFVTNPISNQARRPAGGKRIVEVAGGVLLHTGHTNLGFNKAVKRFRGRWEKSPLPVIVHLLADEPRVMEKMIVRVETIENVAGVEIGFPAEVEANLAAEVLQAAVGELALLARVSLTRAVELADGLLKAGASAICLGPPRGAIEDDQAVVTGRMYGPGIFPQVLYATRELVRQGVPVIAGGGVYSPADVEALADAGALAAQVDTALWRGDWLECDG
jgi:dihydroorotate dehydrogenase